MKQQIKYHIGDYVTFHAKTKKRWLSGNIVKFGPYGACVAWVTWDGIPHHWFVALHKLRKLDLVTGNQIKEING